MKANTPLELFTWAVAYSMRWLGLTSQIETPSRRYVRKLRTRHTKYISGPEALKPGKILNPDWRQFRYVPAAKTDLRVSMQRYKEMVKDEPTGRVHSESKAGHDSGHHGQVLGEQSDSTPNRKFSVVAGKD